MNLSTDLLSQFVKITNDTPKTQNESSSYGRIVTETIDDVIHYYVVLDGSTESSKIPVSDSRTTDLKTNDRVLVTIKNHVATITGNLSAPSATTNDSRLVDIGGALTRLNNLEADNVNIRSTLTSTNATITNHLSASSASFAELNAKNAEIAGKLTAYDADIEYLKTNQIKTSDLDAKYATIKRLDSYVLKSTYGEFVNTTTDKLNAIDAVIEDLDVDNLNASVADIKELIFGDAAGDTIHTDFSNAVIAQVGEAQIKSAMIESVSAEKITAGDIITNNVKVKSKDGHLVISDETMQISDGTRVRVQVGKDAENDYSINIWDAEGNLMFSEGGISDKAIKSAIIRDDMVKDDANISASKLNIDSLFTVINGSSKTINSSHIKLDGENQTLDVAFKSLTDDLTTKGTQISAIQGQITNKIWQQDIDTAKGEMSTQYSSLNQKVDGFESTVASTYATKTDLSNIPYDGRNLLLSTVASRSLTAGSSNYTYTEYYVSNPPLEQGQNYMISANVDVLAGDVTTIAIKLYDKSTSIEGGTVRATIVDGRITGSIAPRSDSVEMLLFYAGINGSTSGNVVRFSNVKLEKGDKITEWAPAPEELTSVSTSAKSAADEAYAFSLRKVTVDLTDPMYNQDTYYPVVGSKMPYDGYKTFQVNVLRNSGSSPTWSTRSDGEFSCNLTARMKANLWGSIDDNHMGWIDDFSYKYSDKSPAYIQQNTNACLPILYLRGGAKYFVYVDYACTWTVHTNDHTASSMTFGPTTKPTNYNKLVNNWTDHNDLVSAKSSITQLSNEIALRVTEEKMNAAIQLKADSIVSTVGDTYLKKEESARDIAAVQTAIAAADERMTESETVIQQLADSISTLVTDGNGESLMIQTENGWTFSTAQIQNIVDETSKNLEILIDDVGDVNTAVDTLQTAVRDLGILNDYVKIGTYEEEPCIELGESDSDFKLLITNTRIMFMEGGNVPAYINNQSLHIQKAVIEEELRQGSFVWKIRSNGNLGLVWKGVNS